MTDGTVYICTTCTGMVYVQESESRLTMASFWRTFYHDGKFSPAWGGWGEAPSPVHSISNNEQSCGVRSIWEGTLLLFLLYVVCTYVCYSRDWVRKKPSLNTLSSINLRARSWISFPWMFQDFFVCQIFSLKEHKCEIFDLLDFNHFYVMKCL